MAQINLNIALDLTDNNPERIEYLTEILSSRLEFIIGEEFGDPSITHRDDVNWAEALYVDETEFPTVTDITVDTSGIWL